jgi:hypothetical protein
MTGITTTTTTITSLSKFAVASDRMPWGYFLEKGWENLCKHPKSVHNIILKEV